MAGARRKILLPFLGLLLLYALVFLFFCCVMPPATAHIAGADGTDYRCFFYPAVYEWLEGSRLYTTPFGFYFPPHAAWLIALMSMPGFSFGLAALRTLTVVIIGIVVCIFCRRRRALPLALMMCLINFYVVDIVFKAQFDAVPLAGLVVGWYALQQRCPWAMGVGYALLAAKPPNFLPVGIGLFVLSVNRWRAPRTVMQSVVLPAVVLCASFLLHPTWLTDWIANYQALPPGQEWPSTLWRAVGKLELPDAAAWFAAVVIVGLTIGTIWRKQCGFVAALDQIALVLTSTFMLTPYVVSYSYSVVLAVALARIVSQNRWVGLGVWVATFVPFFRPHLMRWVDYIVIVACYAGLLYVVLRKKYNAA